jgi:phthiocerol/phenolphthiocerol synthesis type-I polyketide synthase E
MSDVSLAIVGMAVAVPRARTLEQLWHHFEQGVCCIDFWEDADRDPANDLDSMLLQHGKQVLAGGIVDNPALFDAEYFNMSRLDAELLDPQHRVFLEVAHNALENAATPPERRKATGVFAGCAMSSYLHYNVLPRRDVVERVGAYPLTLSNDKDFLATRVSYKLGLGGPSMSVQTACSSSLVAIHVAAQSLRMGECDTALAGGVSIRIPQRRGYLYQPDGVLSPDGRCRPFDHRAGGFVPGNGAVVVVMRRLEDALTDRDPIRAVLRSSAVNNDSDSRLSFTAPSVEGQVRVLSEALAAAELEPGDVTLIEAHGTATALGDPVEFAAMKQVYGASDVPCFIGAAKANMGHLDTAAGALGFVKTVLTLERGIIPPVVNFESPNPGLEIVGTRFRIPTGAIQWPRENGPRRAAVTSLGLGGTNAHAILEEAPPIEQRFEPARARFFPVSAKDPEALQVRRADVAALIYADAAGAASLSYALATGTTHHSYRLAAGAAPEDDATKALMRVAVPSRPARPAEDLRIAMAFPGGGAQHPAMIRGLATAYPAFEEELNAVVALFQPLGVEHLDAAIAGELRDADAMLRRPAIGLPALFCVQLALARLLMRWGITPWAVIGHSAGEYVAACIAGILDPRDAAKLVVARAKGFERAPSGSMLSIGLGVDEVVSRIPAGSALEISVVNGPHDTVIGGPTAAIAAFAETLEDEVRCHKIHIDVAAHTSLVAPIADHLQEIARQMRFSAPRIPCISNVTGTWITHLQPDYWGSHLRQQVRFSEGLNTLLTNPDLVVIDIGPSQTMSPLIEHSGADTMETVVVPLLPRPESTLSPASVLSEAVGRLWAEGAAIDWEALFKGEKLHRVAVAPHLLRRQVYWIEPPLHTPQTGRRSVDHWLHVPVLEPVSDLGRCDEPGRWVICDDGSPLAAALIDGLRERQFSVVTVPSQDDEQALLKLLEQLGDDEPVAGLVLLRTRGSGTFAECDPTLIYHEITAVARAIGEAGTHAPSRLLVVTRGSRQTAATAATAPELAINATVAKVINNENPDLACQSIEIDSDEPDERATPVLIDHIQRRTGQHVVIREGKSWIEGFRRSVPSLREPLLPTGGVWVITGGLGAIGRTLAVHLATRSQARLVLVGRHPLPSPDTLESEERERLNAVAAITDAGGEWEIVVGDIADPEVSRAAFSIAQERFGPVYGVIHAAGVPSGGMIQLRNREAAAAVLAPKIGGVRALASAMPGGVEVVVLCSALDAVLGTLGQGEHCAANAYLDALAGTDKLGAKRVVSIGWCAWRDIGQAARAEVPDQLRDWREQMLAGGLTAEEGCRVFDEVLAGDEPRVIVSVADIDRMRRAVASMLNRMPTTLRARRPQAPSAALRTPTEHRVAELWTEILKADALGPDDDFFAHGGHSLAAMQLLSRMRETFSVAVRLQDLLSRPTLAAQAGLIDLLFLEKVEGMSDEEVKRLLEESG